jgi:hypothetical protein
MRVRAAMVDLLPRRLWRAGNFYMPFNHRPVSYLPESWTITDHTLHFCVAEGRRTVEWDGQEVARGARPFTPPDE